MMIEFFVLFILGLCWGSFLNVFAHRLLHDQSLFTARSRCSSCRATIAWYDNIPLLSWLILRARCRKCNAAISWLYPFIEFLTAITFVLVFAPFVAIPIDFFSGSVWLSFFCDFIFVSALIAATRTDFEAMVIPQCFTLWLVPIGFLTSWLGVSFVSWPESIVGAIVGYGILWLVAFVFKRATGRDGMGEGDMELLAMIGSFLGPIGVWVSLMVGSIVGTLLGSFYLFFAGKKSGTRIPFGPFLALGAIVYMFFYAEIFQFLMRG